MALIFTQYYLDCLSHASYLIGDETAGRAVGGRPAPRHRRVPGRRGSRPASRIERVIETHFHADFLSGHLELAEATGADIVLRRRPPQAEFPIRPVPTAQRISPRRGRAGVRGHARPHARVDQPRRPRTRRRPVPYGVLTGDTLFIGDVGRPDLLAPRGRHRRRPRPPALPLAARQAAHPARRHPRVPRPRRRLGVRQEAVHRDQSRSASSARTTTRCSR